MYKQKTSKLPSNELISLIESYFIKLKSLGISEVNTKEIASRFNYSQEHIAVCIKVLIKEGKIRKSSSFGYYELGKDK